MIPRVLAQSRSTSLVAALFPQDLHKCLIPSEGWKLFGDSMKQFLNQIALHQCDVPPVKQGGKKQWEFSQKYLKPECRCLSMRVVEFFES